MSRFSQMMNTPVPSYKPYEDSDSMLDSGMASNIFSGAMNAIDLPGSMVRDTISFSNPFDQIVTPFSDENRTTGAQISKYWAGGDEDSGGNQLAGMVIDILTDPLMIASGGTAAAGRLGAKAAGSALKGAKKVTDAARSGFRSAKNSTFAGKMAKHNESIDRAVANIKKGNLPTPIPEEELLKQYEAGGYVDKLPPRKYSPEYMAQHNLTTDDLLKLKLTPEDMALKTGLYYTENPKRAYEILKPFSNALVKGGRQAIGSARDTASKIPGTIGSGISEASILVGRGLGFGTDAAKPLRQRDALRQMYAMGTNAMQTATGQRMPQEQSMEEMIAQALMEDPQLMEELLMAMGGDQSGY